MHTSRLGAHFIIPRDPFYEKLSRKQQTRGVEGRKNNGWRNKARRDADNEDDDDETAGVALAFASSRVNRLLIVCMASGVAGTARRILLSDRVLAGNVGG